MYLKSNRRIIRALSFIFSFLLVLQVIPLGVSANGDVGRADGSADAFASEISSDMGNSSVFA